MELQALENAKSLEEVTGAHSRFVVAVQRQCLLAPDKTWKLIEDVVIQILNQVLHFADLQQKLRTPVRTDKCCIIFVARRHLLKEFCMFAKFGCF